MRAFVVGEVTRDAYNRAFVPLFVRAQIPDEATKPGRQTWYARQQAGYSIQAPQMGCTDADYAQEQADLRAGLWAEIPPIQIPVDPNWSNAEIQAALSSTSESVLGALLGFIAEKHAAIYLARDDERFAYFNLSA